MPRKSSNPEHYYLRGACLCGAIDYQSDAAPRHQGQLPSTIYGAAASRSTTGLVAVPVASLSLRGKRPMVHESQDKQGRSFLSTLCPDCGTSLFIEAEHAPFTVFLKTSTLETHTVQKPKSAEAALAL